MKPTQSDSTSTILLYSNADWKAVFDLLVESMTFHMSIQNPVRFHKQTPKLIRDYLQGLAAKHRSKRGVIFVAKDKEGKVLGFVSGELDKQDSEVIACSAKSGSVTEICVAEFARKQGVASKLFDAIEQWLGDRGVKMICLHDVHAANAIARNMYEKRGYVVRVSEYAKLV